MGGFVRGQRPRAVLVDVGGTLIRAEPEPPVVYAQTLSRYGPTVSPTQVGPVFAQVWQEMTQEHPLGLDRYHQVKGGERAWWGTFLQRVLARLQHPAPWPEVLEELFGIFSRPEQWRVYPDAPEVLRRLRQQGVKVAAVSNWDSRLPQLLADLGLTPLLDTVVVSALEGVEKPHPEIFRRALLRLGVPASKATHWGDSPLDDYRGAQACGIFPVLIDREQLFADSYVRAAHLGEAYELVFG
ncbi:MAG: HAD-IA family hydrolase [Thermoanaerobaculum sp.]|nr:HAD-IA family hydrolase [Thermoanaerobaculum sp.]